MKSSTSDIFSPCGTFQVRQARFQVLKSHMWLVLTILDSLTLEYFTVGGNTVLCSQTANHVGSHPSSH